MAQTGAGIQELMAAETRASQIVAEARMGEYNLDSLFEELVSCQNKSILISTKRRICVARPRRGNRMKQAKADAQELIDSYRAEKQEEFNNMVLSKGGTEGSASAQLQADTDKEISELQAEFKKNAQKAVDVLLSKCCEVSLEVPTARVRATQKLAGVTN
eukprot:scaffold305_cov110-Cylindrotheca_fusiformis.AAC.28